MKKISLLLSAATLMALAISCSKQIDTAASRDVNMMVKPDSVGGGPKDTTKGGGPKDTTKTNCTGPASAVTPTLFATVAPGSPKQDEAVTITYGISMFSVTGYVGGKYQLFLLAPSSNDTIWVGTQTQAATSLTGSTNTSFSTVGTWTAGVQYVGARECVGTTPYAYNGTLNYVTTFTVLPKCTIPVDLTVESGVGTPSARGAGFYDFPLTITLKTCGDGDGKTYTIQGGLTAGGQYGAQLNVADAEAAGFTVKILENNYVLTANQAVTGTKIFTVTYSRAATPGCDNVTVTGGWSAVGPSADLSDSADPASTVCAQ